MHESDNVQAVQSLFAAWQRGDADAVAERLTEDVTWEIPGPTYVPFTGRRFGRDEVAKWLRDLNRATELQTLNAREFVAQGDSVAAIGSSVRRARETGRELVLDWVMVFRMRGGKVAEFRQFTDTAAIGRAFDTGQEKLGTLDRNP